MCQGDGNELARALFQVQWLQEAICRKGFCRIQEPGFSSGLPQVSKLQKAR
nr:hypothetical protein [Endozoicomonas sp. SESOKO1]